jgi:hypothetical protein
MPRSPCLFRETDVRRAVKAARSSGIEIAKLEIEPVTGKISITSSSGSSEAMKITDLDSWMAKNESQT